MKEAGRSPVDWREVLRRFVTRPAKTDISWARPNRRFLHRGIYLPGVTGESLGRLAINVDFSGSVCQKTLDMFGSALHAILEPYECVLSLSCSDTKIQHEQEWSPGDGPIKLRSVGGGGTNHHCVFEWLDTLPEEPACLVCLTDGYTSIPTSPPAVAVLWAIAGRSKSHDPRRNLPWGEILHIDD